jgi:predicted peptidase
MYVPVKNYFLTLIILVFCSVFFSCSARETNEKTGLIKNKKSTNKEMGKQFEDTIQSVFSSKDNNQFHQLPFSLIQSFDSTSQEKTTLIVFLHGAGERGMDNKSHLKVGLPNFIQSLKKQGLKNFVVFAPQCPTNERWVDADWTAASHIMKPEPHWPMASALSVIDSLVGSIQNLDDKRIYITGLSMGGYGTWEMIQRRPDFFAAAIPICGGGDKLQASKLTEVPIWAFHGTKDKAVPVIRTTDMYESIKTATKENPLRIKMTLYENKGHLIWNETYDNSEVIKWLLAQRIS